MFDTSTERCSRPVSKTHRVHVDLGVQKQRINRELIHANAIFIAVPPVRYDGGYGVLAAQAMA